MENKELENQQPENQQPQNHETPENQPILKKTAFGGFEKQSVLGYIYELNMSAKEAQDRLAAQLEEVTNSREKLNTTLRELEQRIETAEKERGDLAEELGGEKQRTGELGEMIEALNLQITRHERTLADKDNEITNYRQLNSELAKKNEVLESKKHEVEKASAYIGEILLRTRTDSEKILTDASLKAHELVSEAGKSLETVHAQFEAFQRDMGNLQDQIQSAMDTVRQKFADVGTAVDQAEKDLREIVYPAPPATLKLVQQEDSQRVDDEGEFFPTAAQQ